MHHSYTLYLRWRICRSQNCGINVRCSCIVTVSTSISAAYISIPPYNNHAWTLYEKHNKFDSTLLYSYLTTLPQPFETSKIYNTLRLQRLATWFAVRIPMETVYGRLGVTDRVQYPDQTMVDNGPVQCMNFQHRIYWIIGLWHMCAWNPFTRCNMPTDIEH